MTTDYTAIREAAFKVITDLGLTMTTEFVPFSRSRNKDQKHLSLNWIVTICRNGRGFLVTDYMMGSGHCPSSKKPPKLPNGNIDTYVQKRAIEHECETGKPSRYMASQERSYTLSDRPTIQPDIVDVLHSLILDGDAINFADYESWAGESGYEKDSRAGEACYKLCLEHGLKLRAAIGEDGINAIRKATEEL